MTAPLQPGDRVLVDEDGIYGPLRLWRGTSGVIRSVYPPLVAARLGYDFTVELDAGQFPGEPLQPTYVAIGMRYGEVVADPRSPGSGVSNRPHEAGKGDLDGESFPPPAAPAPRTQHEQVA